MAEPGYLTACETLEKQRVLLESLAKEENASRGLTRAKCLLLHDELEDLKEETCIMLHRTWGKTVHQDAFRVSVDQ
jgi:hypothetical protein